MTVRELIEKLSQLPQDLQIYSDVNLDLVDDAYVDKEEGKPDVVVLE